MKFITLYLQQNLARRHEPTACLSRILDELLPFSYLQRHISYLNERVNCSAFPDILSYLKKFQLPGDLLPRVIPIACVQEPNVLNGEVTGFEGKKILYKEGNTRVALITLKNVNISMIDQISG